MKKSLVKKIFGIALFSIFIGGGVFLAGCNNTAGGGGTTGGGQQGSGWSASAIGINMISITGGSVPLTSSYNPTVSGFRMGETEITQKQYKEILEWAKGDAAVKTKYPDIASANSSPSNFSTNPENARRRITVL